MKRVVVESPFNPPSVELCVPWSRYEVARQNLVYARLAMVDSLDRGESPFLSHLLYTQVWGESPSLRARGIAAGTAQIEVADSVAFYVDLGFSPGMLRAQQLAGSKAVERRLSAGMDEPTVRMWLTHRPLDGWPLLDQLVREMKDGSKP